MTGGKIPGLGDQQPLVQREPVRRSLFEIAKEKLGLTSPSSGSSSSSSPIARSQNQTAAGVTTDYGSIQYEQIEDEEIPSPEELGKQFGQLNKGINDISNKVKNLEKEFAKIMPEGRIALSSVDYRKRLDFEKKLAPIGGEIQAIKEDIRTCRNTLEQLRNEPNSNKETLKKTEENLNGQTLRLNDQIELFNQFGK